MSLPKNVYLELENIVGPENISQDPVILYSYAYRSGLCAGPDHFVPRFEAVILPESAEEVQAIVRACNRYRTQFKASSTGWAFFNDPPGSGVVKLDLRRMNRILEINEKNMYAVVEPYVIGAQLQSELMKRGLNCNLTGAGGQCSALPLAAHENIGHMGQSTSSGDRNLLALEWVTPEGDLVRLGSLGSCSEWFCGDGPGPSLRGVVRGTVTPLGGLGVYTKAAAKVYHWSGPSILPVEGISPRYQTKRKVDNLMVRYFSFSSHEKRLKALELIGEAEISFLIMGFTPSMVAANLTCNNHEEMALLKQINTEVQGPGFFIVIAGNTSNDFEYKRKVLDQIIERTGGKSLAIIENPETGIPMMWRCIRITGSIRETTRAGGTFGGVVGGTDVIGMLSAYVQKTLPIKGDLIKKGLALDDGLEPFISTFEHGHYGHAELLVRFKFSPETAIAMGELIQGANDIALKGCFSIPHHVSGDRSHDLIGPHSCDYHHWLRKIKTAFDPQMASEATYYILSST